MIFKSVLYIERKVFYIITYESMILKNNEKNCDDILDKMFIVEFFLLTSYVSFNYKIVALL
uniref:Putative ovule protein n=1 Tax=Solanum chacoense TaxID=4108 RepID=A0A0V0HPL7_SOLCH